MDAIKAIQSRCSVREFAKQRVSRDQIEKIVDCGRLAPTARKVEPWAFIVVGEEKRLKALAEITDHGKFLKDAAFGVVVCCKETKYYLEDGCAATENMLIAASSMGLGSCWIAGDKKEYASKVLEFVKAPQEYKLISIIAFGYPAHDVKPLQKRPLDEVVHWEMMS